jgi:CRP-like cAMP-binding protein
MGNRYGTRDGNDRLVVEVPFSQTDLANWVGLSREAVVKGLRSLRTLGRISSGARQIIVIDERAVRERSNL